MRAAMPPLLGLIATRQGGGDIRRLPGSNPQLTMNSTRAGITLIIIAVLTVGWYCVCPKTTNPGVVSWKWTGDPQRDDYDIISNRVPSADSRRFWPGVAVIWPLSIGISLLGDSRKKGLPSSI